MEQQQYCRGNSQQFTGVVSGVDNGAVTIYYTVTNNNGCVTQVSKSVTVNALPSTPTISNTTPITFCAGGSVVLTSSAATGNQWYKNSVAITNATGQTYTASASGAYTVIVTNASGCASSASNATTVTVNALPVFTSPTVTTIPTVQYSDPISPVTIAVTDDGGGSSLSVSTQWKLTTAVPGIIIVCLPTYH
jgi:hypothetical protein